MRHFPMFLMSSLGLSGLVLATSILTPSPLLGSTQSVIHSPFCVKYQCRPLNPSQSRGLYLTLPGDEALAGLISDGLVQGMTDVTGLNEYRTFVDFRFDRHKQFLYAEFQLRETATADRGVYTAESALIYEFYKVAVGKALPLGLARSQGNPFSRDVDNCIEGAKVSVNSRKDYLKSSVKLQTSRTSDTITMQCYTGRATNRKGYYSPIVSIGFRARASDFVSDSVFY